MRRIAWLVLLGGCASSDVLNEKFGPTGATIRETIATFPDDQRDAFKSMEKYCVKCHSLAEPFAAPKVPTGGWSRVVHRMARKNGAGIPEPEEPRIAGFLEYYFEKLNPTVTK